MLGKETEFQVEMGTEGRMKGVRGRALALLSDKRNGQRAEEASGKKSRGSSGCCTLVARSVGDSDIAPRDDLSRRTCGTFPKVLGFVVRRK